MTYAHKLVGTAPPVRASFAVGFAAAHLRTAIDAMERGQHGLALSAMQTTLAMLESALAPELRGESK